MKLMEIAPWKGRVKSGTSVSTPSSNKKALEFTQNKVLETHNKIHSS